MSDNKDLITKEEYAKYSHLLKKIISSIIPIYDQYTLEDYVQECIIFLLRKRKESPDCSINTSYLKHVAIKVCVDSVRNISTNIKYYCTNCKGFFHRKERAIDCCKKYNKEGSGYGVMHNACSIEAVTGGSESDKDTALTSDKNPLIFLENSEFFDQFYAILSKDEQKILDLLINDVCIKKICLELNITFGYYRKCVSAIRFTYLWLESRSQ